MGVGESEGSGGGGGGGGLQRDQPCSQQHVACSPRTKVGANLTYFVICMATDPSEEANEARHLGGGVGAEGGGLGTWYCEPSARRSVDNAAGET